MDEETLEAAIAAYAAQLQQVEAALTAGLDPGQQPDLLQLKEDLGQLIELTEASLMSVKASRLLASLEDGDGRADASETSANGNDEFASFYAELGESSGAHRYSQRDLAGEGASGGFEDEEEEEEEEEEDYLSGTKVRAPYRTTWGTLEFHNAMVVGGEPADGDEQQVRVFYLYPTQKAMKPCPFYLEDKCRFLDNCRFSHGEVVFVSELREFLQGDLSHMEEGSSCLTRHEDGIWYPAKIKEIDSGFYTVKFDSALMKDAVVEADGIIPPLREDDRPSSSSDSDPDDTGDSVGYARVLDSEESTVTSNPAEFGGWEAHTRGIGSRLMLKMGYEYGKGLGKMQEGRVEPVTAVVLPKAKSLDECALLTQRRTKSKAAKNGVQTGRPRRRRRRRAAAGDRPNVFDFLNNQLGGRNSGPADGGAAAAATGLEAYRGGQHTKRRLNVRLFQAAERVSQTEREIQKLSESLSKRTGRDPSTLKHLEEKLSAARRLLAQQKAQELSVQREHRKADTHKKMTEF